MKFRKRPVVIEAEQLTWANWGSVCELIAGPGVEGLPAGYEGVWVDPGDGEWYYSGHYTDGERRPADYGAHPFEALPCRPSEAEIGLLIPTLEGRMLARRGDWVIKGVQGELYPCKPDIFAATYDAVEETPADKTETEEWGYRTADGKVHTAPSRTYAERLANVPTTAGERYRPGAVVVRRTTTPWEPADD